MTPSLVPLGAFLLVVALIPLALWTMKRAGIGGAATGGVLRPVASLAVGTTQRVAVVEVTVGAERQWLVIGVTGDQVTPLATYPAPEGVAPAAPALPAHAVTVQQLLARWRGGASSSSSSSADGRGE